MRVTFTSLQDTYQAWYSASADAANGHIVYRNTKGKDVAVTFITQSGADKYLWEDKVFVCDVRLDGFTRNKVRNREFMQYEMRVQSWGVAC